MTTFIPKPDDWKGLGMINDHLTWLAIKPQAQLLVFGGHQHLETYHFEKGARISFRSGNKGQEIHRARQRIDKKDCRCIMSHPKEEDNR